jgi:aminopeptidase N
VSTPAEIEETFDAIAYEKGAAVLRMIERYVGAETFKTGINAYLQAHAYGNATSEDFWTAIAKASGKPVDRIMATFVNQPGEPLITASMSCEAGRTRVALAQTRFFLEAGVAESESQPWQVPVCTKTAGGQTAVCDVLAATAHTISVGSTCAPWVFANAGAQGYYRTAYSPEMLRAIAPHVEEALSAPERLSLAGDEWALVRSGRHSVADYLTLASGYARERTSGVLAAVTNPFSMLHQYLTTDESRPKFEEFVRNLLRPLFDDIGFAPRPGESDDQRQLRAIVIRVLGATGEDPKVVEQARAVLDRALSANAPQFDIDATVASSVLTVAARYGDRKLFDALRNAAERATSPEEHYRYLYTVTDFRNPVLIDLGLEYALSPQLRSQDTAVYLAQYLANPAARAKTWAFVKAHWAELEPKIFISEGDRTLVSGLGAFCDAVTRDDIRTFFTAHPPPTAARTLNQTIERITNCIALREKQTPILTAWLEHQ